MKKLEFLISTYSLILILLFTACGSEDAEPSPPTPQAPSIIRIEPDQGKFGDLITISGLNFGSTVAENTVTFNGLQAVVTNASTTQLVAEVPKGAGNGPIELVTDTGTTTSNSFTYLLRAVVETMAGTGEAGYQDGPGSEAQFNMPHGLYLQEDGTLLIADRGNGAIRQMSVAGTVRTIARSQNPNLQLFDVLVDWQGEMLVTASNKFGLILKVDPAGDTVFELIFGPTEGINQPLGITKLDVISYVADRGNHVIFRMGRNMPGVEPRFVKALFSGTPGRSGFVDGTSANALFNQPQFLAAVELPEGRFIYVSETGNHSIRSMKLNPNNLNFATVTTEAGSGQAGFTNGIADQAQLNNPKELAVDQEGNIYVADFGNNAVRKISPDREVTTVLKSESMVSSSAEPQLVDGPDGEARLNGPYGIAIAPDGSLFVSDIYHHAIRRITFE